MMQIWEFSKVKLFLSVFMLIGLIFLLLNVVSPLIDLISGPLLQSNDAQSLQVLLIVLKLGV